MFRCLPCPYSFTRVLYPISLESLTVLKVISQSMLSDLGRIALCLSRYQITGVWQEEAVFLQEQVAK